MSAHIPLKMTIFQGIPRPNFAKFEKFISSSQPLLSSNPIGLLKAFTFSSSGNKNELSFDAVRLHLVQVDFGNKL